MTGPVQGVRVSVPAKYHRWAAWDDERLRAGYRRGDTAEVIASALNVTPAAVGNRAKKLGQGHRRRGRSLEQRFWDYVSCEPNSGCWLWEGACDRKGYGQLRMPNNIARLATHIALELRGHKVSKGMQACHRCDVPACVNPDHLFVGTPKDNTRDMIGKGRNSPPPPAKPGQGTHQACWRGHLLQGHNLVLIRGKRAGCRECERLRKADRRANFVAQGLRCDGLPRAVPG